MKSFLPPKLHWLDVAEITAAVGSVGGSLVAGVFFKHFLLLWATVPLSASAALALINHQRLKLLIAEDKQAIATSITENKTKLVDLTKASIEYRTEHKTSTKKLTDELEQVRGLAVSELARLQQEEQANFSRTSQELQQLQSSVGKLDSLSQSLQQNLQTIEGKQQETGRIVRELKAIDIFTQNINADLNTVQSYFERGLAYQRMGNKHRAIDDFSKTIELDNNHPQAYHQRGLMYVELGIERKAVDDLRRASQLYFDKGELDKYRETRDLGQQMYQDRTSEPQSTTQAAEQVVVGNLFG